MKPSILKSVLFVALGITSAAAMKYYECCAQEDCTDCVHGGMRDDDFSCPMCQYSPGKSGKDVSSPSPNSTYTPSETQMSALCKMLTVKAYRSVQILL